MNKDSFFNNLNNIFDKSSIKFDIPNKEKYRNDWSTSLDSDPIAVVFPTQVEQIIDVIKLCNEFNHPLVPSGGRTGLSGGASATSNELIVSFDKMNKILEFDDSSNTVLCQPGLITQNLQSFADENNLYYPVDFSSSGSSQLGGNIATNAGGIRVIKYGSTSSYVAGLCVVTGNGDYLSLDDMLIKNATGPDIKNLFIGCEGIYGLTTSCRIQLISKPEETKVILIGFDEISSLDSISNLILQFDIEAIEFFTRYALNQVNKEFNIDIDHLDNNYFLIIEFTDQKKFIDMLETLHNKGHANEIIISTNNSQKELIWQYRLLISESISRSSPIKFDVAVPIKNISKLIIKLECFFKENKKYTLILFGHLGDGNLHVNVLKNEGGCKPEDINFIEKNIHSIVLDLSGTLSAEHGIGLNKIKAFMHYENKTKIDVIKNLKQFFDNKKILNPGKLVK